MSTFAFRAVDVAGIPSRGGGAAESKGRVSEQGRGPGLIGLDVTEKSEAFRLEQVFDRFRSIKARDMAIFSRQFATLIESGMPMLRSLHTLEDQTEDERLRNAITGIRQDVEAGSSLADAMERRPQIFDPMFRAMVRSGEGSGRLDEALERVAYHLEKLDALKRQIRSAMLYPAFVFGFAIVVLLIVVAFIVPVFAGVFKEVVADQPGESSQLPLLTRVVMTFSSVITGYWFLWIPALVGGTIGLFQWKKTEWGRPQWDALKLKIPFHIGNVIQKASLARWSRTFAGTVASGVPILQSIKITGQTSGNSLVERSMDEVYDSVRGGGTIAHPIEKSDLYPPMVGHMLTVGEETGQLEAMLTKIADFYEAEVDAKVKALTALLEPLMIVFVGGIVGVIVISMYLPIFALYDKIR